MNLKVLKRLIDRLPGVEPLRIFFTGRRIIVRGGSMSPALRPGERVLFDQRAYRDRAPQAGDVVLARHAARPGIEMIKRVIAVPGERTNGHLLGEGEYWLEGDSPESTDSRQLGPFRAEEIVARAWLVYWPAGAVRRV